MKAIVAVYHAHNNNMWGIGANGTQPLVLNADRVFFRKTTKGHTVIVGYKTLLDFPNQQPLPARKNIVLTRQNIQIPGAEIVHNTQELDLEDLAEAFVIGGASVYKQLLPFCDEVYVTHIYKDINPDVFFPNLAIDSQWESQVLDTGYENEIEFKIEKFIRKKE